jgi:ketosteroid isomerase-like protein
VVLDRFAAAFEGGDMAALAALLRADVALEMPPLATWFSGRETVLRYLASNLCTAPGRTRLVPAEASGQPAFAAYLRDDDGVYRAHSMIVLTLTGTLITRIVIFLEPALFRLFGLARELAPGKTRPTWSEFDAGAHDDGAVAGELEVLGRVGRQPGGGDEDVLAPLAHARGLAPADLDGGEEVGDVVVAQRGLGRGPADEC